MTTRPRLTDQYWDCECPDDHYQYIHHRTETQCHRCGAVREDQPPSHVDEVLAAGYALKGEDDEQPAP